MIDGHVHFFDPDRPEGLDWPKPGSGLASSASPSDLVAVTGNKSLDGVVAVETSRRFADDQWLLDQASKEPLILGLVLNLQPDLPDFQERLDTAQSSTKFRGIRLRPIADYNLSSALLRESLHRLSMAEHTVELGAKTAAHKRAFIGLAKQFNNSHWILDHSGHPGPGWNMPNSEWITSMTRIAKLPNVFVKATSPYDLKLASNPEDVATTCKSLVSKLRGLFGIDRLVFGSNWPVCAVNANYLTVVRAFESCLGSDRDRERFFHLNARRAYRI